MTNDKGPATTGAPTPYEYDAIERVMLGLDDLCIEAERKQSPAASGLRNTYETIRAHVSFLNETLAALEAENKRLVDAIGVKDMALQRLKEVLHANSSNGSLANSAKPPMDFTRGHLYTLVCNALAQSDVRNDLTGEK